MTYLQLRTHVAQRLGISLNDSDAVGQINVLLNQEHARLVEKYALVVSVGTLTLTASDPVVSVPASWLRTLTIYEGSNIWREASWQEYTDAVAAGASSIYPDEDGLRAYVMSGDELRVYPEPDSSGSATMYYVPAPTAMSSDGDTPTGIPDHFHDLLAELVVEKMAVTEEEHEIANAARASIAVLSDSLKRHLARRPGKMPNQVRLKGYPPR